MSALCLSAREDGGEMCKLVALAFGPLCALYWQLSAAEAGTSLSAAGSER